MRRLPKCSMWWVCLITVWSYLITVWSFLITVWSYLISACDKSNGIRINISTGAISISCHPLSPLFLIPLTSNSLFFYSVPFSLFGTPYFFHLSYLAWIVRFPFFFFFFFSIARPLSKKFFPTFNLKSIKQYVKASQMDGVCNTAKLPASSN